MNESNIRKESTVDYLTKSPEGLYFDRKKAKIDPKDLANCIASFANANGGTLVVGVNNDGIIEGFNEVGVEKFNELQKVVTSHLKNIPKYEMEILNIENYKNEQDKIIVFHIDPTMNVIIRNNRDEVYMRQGDSSIKLNSDQVRSLEYDRKERDFESEIVKDSTIDDLDLEMLELYKKRLNTNLSVDQILEARGFIKMYQNQKVLTAACILLFAKNPSKYLPNARVRVIKFEGTDFKVGTEMNIIKDRTFDSCLYKTIENAKEFINSQLREFTHLSNNGIFDTVPEYPEFAWYEGLVNAVTHRDYSNSGEHITIKLYDDRMEIYSPGKLGGFVTIDTMRTKRYSRNPQVARVLNELGIVRELNEGVKRIYQEMERFFLEDPIYSEPDRNSVLLVLKNNIVARNTRKNDSLLKSEIINSLWSKLNPIEQIIVQGIHDKGEMSMQELIELTKRSRPTVLKMIDNLKQKEIVEWYGTTPKDPQGKYKIKNL